VEVSEDDGLDALAGGFFPPEAVTAVRSSPACWAAETLLCHFDELTASQTITMVLVTSSDYAGMLTTTATLTPTYPYVVESNPANNRGSDRVQVI
jgi:hypothetical protein